MPQEESQLSLTADEDEPSKGRVHIVATVMAGMTWPGQAFDRLPQPRRRLAYDVARDALKRLQEAE